MMQHFIGQTHNGIEVYVELIGTEAGKQVARLPQLLTLAKEMLTHITVRDSDIHAEHDMQRPIGYSSIALTTDQNIVFYACLPKDDVFTRFVKNVEPKMTRYLSMQLLRSHAGNYELTNIWIGRLRPALPGSPAETAAGKPYWANHAIIYSDQQLQPQTITKVCPY